MLDNKSLVSSANYLTDLNSTYSKAIVLYKNNILIPNGINHTIEATVSYFDKFELVDKELILKAPVVINSNASMLVEISNIVSEISTQIDDSITLNSSAINGSDLVLDISVSTDSTILKTLNIKVKYENVVKYDIYSTSSEYIQILTNAGLLNIDLIDSIRDVGNKILPNIDELLLVDDKANEVSINTDLVSTMKSEVISMKDETIVNRDNSISSAASALVSANSALASLTSTLESEANANVSEVNAKESELNSKDSENIAKTSESVSMQKANEATAKAAEALASANNAHVSELSALDSKNIAITKASEALQSASNASTSAINAESSNQSAISARNTILAIELQSETFADNAETSALDAANSALSASSSASESENQAIVATTKAGEALASANNADLSEANALSYKNSAEASAISAAESSDTSSAQAIISTQKANEASISASNADDSETNALVSKNLAEKWASEAEDIVVASGKYSAYHYMLKAEEYAASASSGIDDNNSSTITTYSSNKINNTYYTKVQNDTLFGTKIDKNNPISASTGTKITYDSKGLVTGSESLSASDVPSLDASKITSGTIDPARLPAYVDDVLEFPNLAFFPATGEKGKIYVAATTNKAYRWSGSTYIYITSGAVDSVAGKTGVVTLVKGDVGLENVDNTADIDKPISTAISLALGLKADKAGKLSQFSATSSSELAGVISDETGTGKLVFATSPTLVTPALGVATGTSFNSITGLSSTTPLVDGAAAIGTSTAAARADHAHPTDASRAPLVSPAFTGNPTAPTASVGDSGTTIATTAFVNAEIANDAIPRVASTDNAIPRFDGTTGAVQNSGVYIADNANMGVGAVPKTSYGAYETIQLGDSAALSGFNGSASKGYVLFSNCYRNISNLDELLTDGVATKLLSINGKTTWLTSDGTGIAGNAVTLTNKMILSQTGVLTMVSPTGGIGYGTGAGGTVTQLTSKSTGVTLNKPCGLITMHNEALAPNAVVVFPLNNNLISVNDLVLAHTQINSVNYEIKVFRTINGLASISVKNVSASSLSDALQIQFAIIKGVNA